MSVSKIVAAAASGVGGGDLDVDEVFSTFVWNGNGSAQTITNGIDLSGKGGLVWSKTRTASFWHWLTDTERGNTHNIFSNATNAQNTLTNGITSFNSNGFSVGNSANINDSSNNYVSWTFRKAPKFFDVVTFSATGSGSLTLSHNLGSTPAFIIVKSTSHAQSWYCYHHTLNGGTDPEDYFLKLDSNVAKAGPASSYWGGTAPTSTQFTVGTDLNISGRSYVAYLFAHNNNDGEFGPDGDQDIIKCGSYTGDGSATGPEINLGFEPQWVMIKRTNSTGDFAIFDNMRGITSGGVDGYLIANGNQQEYQIEFLQLLSNGFQPTSTNSNVNASGSTYIYMAIRRGPLAVPEDATKVFAMDTYDTTTGDSTAYDTTFTVDMVIQALNKNTTNNKRVSSRLTGARYVSTNTDSAESGASSYTFDTQTGFRVDPGTDANDFAWMWKRAPGYFDVTTFSGTGATELIKHNLGAVPEMIWLKGRTSSDDWYVFHKDLTSNSGNSPSGYLKLNTSDGQASAATWAYAPTSSEFYVTGNKTNASGQSYIAYLFATVAGVSKVGSYSGNNSSQTIDCGFTSGARFVLIKCSNDTGDWYVWDTERGIVSGNDSFLILSNTEAENTQSDDIDPQSTGFIVNHANAGINESGKSYIFYAIA